MLPWKGLLISLLFIDIAIAIDNLSGIPGGSLIVVGARHFGNNVTSRMAFLPSGAKKTWMDFETLLPSGRLQKFFFFVYNATSEDDSPVNIRLQIWEPADTVNYQFRIRWQTIVSVDLQMMTGIFYTYTLPDKENVEVKDGDRIGWTFEDDRGAISFTYNEGHRTIYKNVVNNVYPVVGESYVFTDFHFPSVFSVAVEVMQAVPSSSPEPTSSPLPSVNVSATASTQSTTSRSTLINLEQSSTSSSFITMTTREVTRTTLSSSTVPEQTPLVTETTAEITTPKPSSSSTMTLTRIEQTITSRVPPTTETTSKPPLSSTIKFTSLEQTSISRSPSTKTTEKSTTFFPSSSSTSSSATQPGIEQVNISQVFPTETTNLTPYTSPMTLTRQAQTSPSMPLPTESSEDTAATSSPTIPTRLEPTSLASPIETTEESTAKPSSSPTISTRLAKTSFTYATETATGTTESSTTSRTLEQTSTSLTSQTDSIEETAATPSSSPTILTSLEQMSTSSTFITETATATRESSTIPTRLEQTGTILILPTETAEATTASSSATISTRKEQTSTSLTLPTETTTIEASPTMSTRVEQTSMSRTSQTKTPTRSTTTSTATTAHSTTAERHPTIMYHDGSETAFVAMNNTRSVGNPWSPSIASAATTLTACLEDCLSRESPCFGVDYNSQLFTCHLLSDFNYMLEPIGTTLMVNNYRRTFHVKSFCYNALYFRAHQSFSSLVSYQSQPNTVDTLDKCHMACLGPFGNGMLENGFQCTAGVFDSSDRSCKLTDVDIDSHTVTDSETAEHFQNIGVQCVQMPKAACSTSFSAVHNRKPVEEDRQSIQEGVLTIPDCANQCMKYQLKTSNLTCQGFAFTYNVPVCALYLGEQELVLEDAEGTDFYQITPLTCARCGYVYHPDTSGTGGTFLHVSTRGRCRDRCDRWTQDNKPDEVCYGFNVRSNGSDINCHIITERGFTSNTTMGTNLHEWDPVCQDCDPTGYIITAHTSPVGGNLIGKRSLALCAHDCQQSVSLPMERRCHGFSHNRVSNECHLFYDYEYDLNGIGVSVNSDHYRRMYTCSLPKSSPCASYNKTSNVRPFNKTSNAQPSVSSTDLLLQPWDIRTIERCTDRCNGYSSFTNTTCHGLVFDHRTSRCELLLGNEGEDMDLEFALGQDYYRRNTVWGDCD